jgi:hypothetical protein
MKSKRVLICAIIGSCLVAADPAYSGKKLDGRWRLWMTIPEAPDTRTTRTFAVDLDVSPRGEGLHGRMLITDPDNRTVGGVWRQVGKRVSIAYEPPCEPDGPRPCSSLILLGRIKSGGLKIKGGKVIVVWDTPNDQDPALYDTSVGSFSGDRLP